MEVMQIEARFKEAARLYRERDFEEALKALEEVRGLFPETPPLSYLEAQIYAGLRNTG